MQTIGPPQWTDAIYKNILLCSFFSMLPSAPPVYIAVFWPDKIICDVIPKNNYLLNLFSMQPSAAPQCSDAIYKNILFSDLFSMLPSAPPGEQMQFIKIIICWICSRCNHRPPPVFRCNLWKYFVSWFVLDDTIGPPHLMYQFSYHINCSFSMLPSPALWQ